MTDLEVPEEQGGGLGRGRRRRRFGGVEGVKQALDWGSRESRHGGIAVQLMVPGAGKTLNPR